MREGIVAIDDKGKITFVNRAATEMLGYETADELIGKHVLSLISERKRVKALVRELVKEGFSDDTELKLLKKNGSLLDVVACTTVHKDKEGKALGVVGIFRQYTQGKRREQELIDSEERFRWFFEEDLAGNYVSKPDGRILMCNLAFAQLLGYAGVQEVLRDSAYSMYESFEQRQNFLRSLQEKKRLERFEHRYRRKDGKPVHVLEKAVGGFNEKGELVQIQGHLVDDSARTDLEQQVTQIQKMESIGILAGGIAHDFNNILGIILGHTALLEGSRNNETRFNASLSAINKAVERGASIVSQILTFARKAETKAQPTDVNSLVSGLDKMLNETFPKTIVLTLKLEDDLPVMILDQTQLHQALLNLCINGHDAMNDKGNLTITTRLVGAEESLTRFPRAQAKHYVQISVADTGKGMDEQTQKRIFEPFFSTRSNAGGTGLGLAVVYGIVRSHNGFIEVESALGVGSTFHLFFPVQEDIVVPRLADMAQPDEIESGKETILVVEDEDGLRELLTTILQLNGYKVFSASDGEEALKCYTNHKEKINLVLSDMGLPKQSGLEVFKAIRGIDPRGRMILASGYLDQKQRQDVLESGIRGFIQKPYKPQEILKAVRQVLDERDRAVWGSPKI